MTDASPHSTRVLVTDGDQRATLAVVRSLGAAGYEIHVCAESKHSLAGASRYAASEHAVGSALHDTAGYVERVAALIRMFAIAIVLPMTEPALLALLPERERFPGVLMPFANADTFSNISDKARVLDAAACSGIAIPQQLTVADAGDAAALDTGTVKYPVVVKPSRSVSGTEGKRVKSGAQHAANRKELEEIIHGTDPQSYPLLIQQRIIGPGVGVFLLLWENRIVAQFAHQRLREKPPSGGISVYRKSIVVDENLLNASVNLLRQFDWRGVAMVEYKVDETSGQPYLMEVNGRFWGSLQLAIDSGVDFPRLLVQSALGEEPAAVTNYDTQVRSRWFWGDVDNLIARMRHSNEELALPPRHSSRWRAVGDFFLRHPHDVNEVFRLSDPKPFARESLQWLQEVMR